MLRAGKVHIIPILAAAGIILLAGLLFLARESPVSAADRFLVALAKGDVDQLMDLSYYAGDREELRRQWEFATQEAGKYYRFRYKIRFAREVGDTAAVSLEFERDALSGASFPENRQIPMVRDGGRWKVDVAAITRDLYPALPR
ncbi:MAG: hypothetical protein SNJ74_02280 [Fimbriimonadaceae bacterium]